MTTVNGKTNKIKINIILIKVTYHKVKKGTKGIKIRMTLIINREEVFRKTADTFKENRT